MKTSFQNNLFLLKYWTLPVAGISLLAFILFHLFKSGTVGGFLIVGNVLVLTGVLSAFVIIRTRRKLADTLQYKSATPFITFYAKTAGSGPNGQHLLASGGALVAAYYGELDRARDCIQGVAWESVSPLLRAGSLHALAIMSYVEGLYELGIDYSDRAIAESDFAAIYPGSRTTKLTLQNCRNLGLVLARKETPMTIEELEQGFRKLPLLAQFMPAWGLAIAYARMNNHAASQKMVDHISLKGPYFSGILESIDGALHEKANRS